MMPSFAQRCGIHDAERAVAAEAVVRRIRENGIERVRIAWCDLHGVLRAKTLVAGAVADALASGVGMASTLMLKDTSDRTAYRVFEPGLAEALPGFGQANNVLLLPDPQSFVVLPWAEATGWMQSQPWFDDATPITIDTRRVLQQALRRLDEAGYGLCCGLEVEFHVYRIKGGVADPSLDPEQAAWPGEPPPLTMIHPGYNLLAEGWADMADEVFAIIHRTTRGLGLPLRSLEIELGPSQVEAVFDATDALTAADHMVLFRNGVRQALRRAGYHASFVCRPPFPNVMASGWHLHQSLVERVGGRNAFCRDAPAAGSSAADASHVLSEVGGQWLAGLLMHGRGMAIFCSPTINGFGRFRANALAPLSVLWGRDNRGAMLRVLGGSGDPATRIENRIGEPAANPYLYIAAQIHAGLDGIARRLVPGPATLTPYAPATTPLPTSLGEALKALDADRTLVAAFGPQLVDCLERAKRAELARHDQAEDREAWQRREYFSRF
jgi:glutamine synthetase